MLNWFKKRANDIFIVVFSTAGGVLIGMLIIGLLESYKLNVEYKRSVIEYNKKMIGDK